MREAGRMKYSVNNFYISKDGLCVLRNMATIFGEHKVLTTNFLDKLDMLFNKAEMNLFIENYILFSEYQLVISPLFINAVDFEEQTNNKITTIGYNDKFLTDDLLSRFFSELEKQEESNELLFVGLINSVRAHHRVSIHVRRKLGEEIKFYLLDTNSDVVLQFNSFQSLLVKIRFHYPYIVEVSHLVDIHGDEAHSSKFNLDFIV